MGSKQKALIGALIFLLMLAGAWLAYDYLSDAYRPQLPLNTTTPDTDEQGESPERQSAPDFTVTDWDGTDVRLSDFFGKPVIVNFWASWCPPCREEMADFDRVYADFSEDIHFLMVNQTDGQRETMVQAREFIESGGYHFPVYFDEELDASIAYGISALPTTLFIDSEGYILGGIPGAIDEDTLREVIDLFF